jgi:hypothetical protein
MSSRLFRRTRGICLLPLTVALVFQPPALAQDGCAGCAGCALQGGCQQGCDHHHCPPCFIHCTEGPPKIKFKCACPKPVCPPDCDTPNWGYFQPCWRPWPWPPDWSHCPVPPAAAFVTPCNTNCYEPGFTPPPVPAGEQLPSPRKIDPNLRQGL